MLIYVLSWFLLIIFVNKNRYSWTIWPLGRVNFPILRRCRFWQRILQRTAGKCTALHAHSSPIASRPFYADVFFFLATTPTWIMEESLTVLAFNYTLFNKALHPNISIRCKMIRRVKGSIKLVLFLQRSRLMKPYLDPVQFFSVVEVAIFIFQINCSR